MRPSPHFDVAERKSPVELVRAVLDYPLVERWDISSLCLLAAPELEKYPPDVEAVTLVVEALRSQKLEPWHAALLLGALRHSSGYPIVLGMLRGGGGQSAEIYAGPALANIGGARAFDDLVAVLRDPSLSTRSHEGAGYGLGLLDDPRVLEVVTDAARRGLLSEHTAGFIIARTAPEAQLLAWIAGRDELLQATAQWAFFFWSAGPRPYPSAHARAKVLRAVKRWRSPLSSDQVRMLRERFA